MWHSGPKGYWIPPQMRDKAKGNGKFCCTAPRIMRTLRLTDARSRDLHAALEALNGNLCLPTESGHHNAGSPNRNDREIRFIDLGPLHNTTYSNSKTLQDLALCAAAAPGQGDKDSWCGLAIGIRLNVPMSVFCAFPFVHVVSLPRL